MIGSNLFLLCVEAKHEVQGVWSKAPAKPPHLAARNPPPLTLGVKFFPDTIIVDKCSRHGWAYGNTDLMCYRGYSIIKIDSFDIKTMDDINTAQEKLEIGKDVTFTLQCFNC